VPKAEKRGLRKIVQTKPSAQLTVTVDAEDVTGDDSFPVLEIIASDRPAPGSVSFCREEAGFSG